MGVKIFKFCICKKTFSWVFPYTRQLLQSHVPTHILFKSNFTNFNFENFLKAWSYKIFSLHNISPIYSTLYSQLYSITLTCIDRWSLYSLRQCTVPSVSGQCCPPTKGFIIEKINHNKGIMFGGRVATGDGATTTNYAYIFSVTHNTIVSYIIYYYYNTSQNYVMRG